MLIWKKQNVENYLTPQYHREIEGKKLKKCLKSTEIGAIWKCHKTCPTYFEMLMLIVKSWKKIEKNALIDQIL